MTKVLVVSTSRKTRGGITAVLKLYEQSEMWRRYHCRWVGTHRDGNSIRKIWYIAIGIIQFIALAPFYDIIHIHFSLPGTVRRKYPIFKIAKFYGKKVVIHMHCGSQIDRIWDYRYQYMFERCDCGILLSESLKEKVINHIGKTDKLRVIYNPCPIVTDNPVYKKDYYILFSGTLYEGKGYKDLIRAFSRIAPNHPEWKIVLAGNGEEAKARALASELKIDNQVELLGWVSGERKHKAFSEAMALCLPSYAEGFPMAVLDAWAYGLPVITTPVGGIPDIAVDGVNMLLFTPGDVETLAEKLDMVISDASIRKTLSAESLHLARGKFNVNTITDEVSAIYEELVGKSD